MPEEKKPILQLILDALTKIQWSQLALFVTAVGTLLYQNHTNQADTKDAAAKAESEHHEQVHMIAKSIKDLELKIDSLPQKIKRKLK
jgi:hypothetical protein